MSRTTMAEITDIFGSDPEPDEAAPSTPRSARSCRTIAAEIYEDLSGFLEGGYPDPPRAPGLHCSSLWKTCARAPLLAAQYPDLEEPRKEKAGGKATTLGGEFVHDGIQNKIGIPWQRIWGDWKCIRCQKIVHTGLGPSKCPECGVPFRDDLLNIGLSEGIVNNKELGYKGHYDGIHVHADGVHRLFEFKTISDSQWRPLKEPKHAHIVQAHAYMYDLGLRETVFFYWNRGKQADWSKPNGRWTCGPLNVKVFVVTFDDALWEKMKKRIMDYHKAGLHLYKKLPVTDADVMAFPRLCSHRTCEMAGECSSRSACFNLPR